MKEKLRILERYYYFFYYTKKAQIINRLLSLLLRPISQRIIHTKKWKIDNKLNYFSIIVNKSSNSIVDILNNQFVFLNKKK